MRADFSKRAEIVAQGDERRAEVYRTDVEFTGEKPLTRTRMPTLERRQLAAWVHAQYEAGRRCKDIAEELGCVPRKVSQLRSDHLLYEAKDRLRKEKEKK